jgi:glycerophosphoryl diester phosphodiesterase
MTMPPIRPLVIAHRGLHTSDPENSLAALRAGMACADGFETDIFATADGVLVLSHDPDAPDGRPINMVGYSELRALWQHAGNELASLEELLAAAVPGSFACLELKAPGLGVEVFKLAAPIFGKRLRISSFEPAYLAGVPLAHRWLNVRGTNEVPNRVGNWAGLCARADAYPLNLPVPERAAWRVPNCSGGY